MYMSEDCSKDKKIISRKNQPIYGIFISNQEEKNKEELFEERKSIYL